MIDESDWRLQGQEKFLQGVVLVKRRYRSHSQNPDRDHDHCEFCWAKFMVEGNPDSLHEGYSQRMSTDGSAKPASQISERGLDGKLLFPTTWEKMSSGSTRLRLPVTGYGRILNSDTHPKRKRGEYVNVIPSLTLRASKVGWAVPATSFSELPHPASLITRFPPGRG